MSISRASLFSGSAFNLPNNLITALTPCGRSGLPSTDSALHSYLCSRFHPLLWQVLEQYRTFLHPVQAFVCTKPAGSPNAAEFFRSSSAVAPRWKHQAQVSHKRSMSSSATYGRSRERTMSPGSKSLVAKRPRPAPGMADCFTSTSIFACGESRYFKDIDGLFDMVLELRTVLTEISEDATSSAGEDAGSSSAFGPHRVATGSTNKVGTQWNWNKTLWRGSRIGDIIHSVGRFVLASSSTCSLLIHRSQDS